MKLDIIYTYYNGNDLLDDYLYHWNNNFNNTTHDINFVIVDDHSTKKAIDVVNRTNINCNLQIYYIEDNIIWNEEGAKNLGVKQTNADIVLLLDWDCVIYEKLVQEILSWDFSDKLYYQFYIIQDSHASKQSNTPIKYDFIKDKIKFHRHYAAVCMSRGLFNKCGGYDEDFCGNYGYSDMIFSDNLRNYDVKRNIINKNLLYLASRGRTKNVNRLIKSEVKQSHNWRLYQALKSKAYTPSNPIRFKYIKQYENYI